MTEERKETEGVEPTGFATRPVIIFGVSLVISLGVVFLISAWIVAAVGEPTDEVRSEAPPWAMEDPERVPEDPADWPPPLQPDPEPDYEALRDRQTERLETYGWVDRDEEIVRVPIEEAMELILRDEPIAGELSEEGGE